MEDLERLLRETLEAREALAPLLERPESRPAQPGKRKALEGLLDQGLTQVHIDTTLPGVDVPGDFLGEPLVLNFSLNFAVKDLRLTDAELEQTLSFAGVSHRVRVPLRAIVAAGNFIKGELRGYQVFGTDGLDVPADDDDLEPPPRAG